MKIISFPQHFDSFSCSHIVVNKIESVTLLTNKWNEGVNGKIPVTGIIKIFTASIEHHSIEMPYDKAEKIHEAILVELMNE